MKFERRRNHRFQMRSQAFVNMHDAGGGLHILGQLLDISQCGLALSYLPEIYGTLPEAESGRLFRLDLFISGQPMFLEGLPARLIYDFGLPNPSPIAVVSTRKCGLSLCTMPEIHETKLRHFIRRSFYAFA